MKTIKLLTFLALSLFLVSFASAVNTYGEFTDKTSPINYGDSISLDAYVGTMNPSMTIKITLTDTAGTVLKEILPSTVVATNTYFNTFIIDSSVYPSAGDFRIKIWAQDQIETNEYTLSLLVNPVTVSNNAPVITSTAIIQVTEGQAYSYQLTATDANSDTLIYSITTNPGWLSISSSGLITGTAPSVTTNTDYSVVVSVSDGTDSVTQSYTLTVMDATTPADTTAPILTISEPQNGVTYSNAIEYLHFTATDENLASCEYSIDNGVTKTPVACTSAVLQTVAVTASEGSNIWTVYATDIAGNTAETSVTFTVNTSAGDSQAPIITTVTPVAGKTYTDSTITFKIILNEDATVYLKLDSGASRTMANPTDHIFTYTMSVSDGAHTVVFYATDSSGNEASQRVDFRVDAVEEKKTSEQTYSYEDELGKEQYMQQMTGRAPIVLGEDTITEKKVSLIERLIQAIINFFKRLFGLQ